jgi:hypothetical protein
MREPGKLYAQAQSMASTLLMSATHTCLMIYVHESSAERVKEWLREWSVSFPALADWEKRVTFRHFDERPKLETLPKMTFDEWVDMPEIPPELWSANERLNRMWDLLSGADPEIFKREKEKESDENINPIR